MMRIFKYLVAFTILYLLFWGAIELLWEEDIVSDGIHDKVNRFGVNLMAFILVGGIGVYGIMCAYFVWNAW